MKGNRSRLQQIQRNHTKLETCVRAGTLAEQWIVSLSQKETCAARAIAMVLAEAVDSPFRQHCRVGNVCRGVLTIYVDPPELVYPMRMHWLFRLKERLHSCYRAAPVSRIIFEAGRDGLPIAGEI